MVVVGELGVIHSMETSVMVLVASCPVAELTPTWVSLTDSVDKLPVVATGSGAVAASQ